MEDTRFTKDPTLVQGVDEEDGRLRDGHEEVADRQVHDEKIGRSPQLLVAEKRCSCQGFHLEQFVSPYF